MLVLICFKNLAVDRILKGNFLNVVSITPHSTVCTNYLFFFFSFKVYFIVLFYCTFFFLSLGQGEKIMLRILFSKIL